MSDIEQEMEKAAERAEALGVNGEQTTDQPESADEGEETEDDELEHGKTASEEAETPEVSATSETLETQETAEAEEDEREPGGLNEHVYPNPDKKLGSLIDTYENFNVYVPPEVKKEINAFYKQVDYEFSQEHGDELDKHWDFYTAIFRIILQNRELIREELEMSESD